ncbi:hypothetical protein L2E82_43097 [Cichorium intybus]|uniref:Uncharacterized protein n=1 Tax=Cichorium intybus TaxID=13427 RepID=A0ACB8ZMP1_CICIN|nr:hypothetical protein L2E82_43097 [Cichorium intybus]
MQKGDNNEQGPERTSGEITGALWRGEALHTSLESNLEDSNYFNLVKVLSEVELPSPSPVQTTCALTREENFIRFHQGQSSGTKRKADDTEGNSERERGIKSKQDDCRPPGSQRDTTRTNITEKRRRNKISERIRTLQTLVPNCDKRHKASILSDAIDYIKFLQMQVQMQSMEVAQMSQGYYMTLPRQPSLQVPNVPYNFPTRPLIGMQHGMPQLEPYVPVNLPIFPNPFTGFTSLVPPMELGTREFPWAQPRPLLYPQQLQFQPQTSQSVYSTTPFPGTSIPTPYSQGGSTVPGQPLYHVPVTSQGTG